MAMEISHHPAAPGKVVVTLAGRIMMGVESERILTLVDELLAAGTRTIVFDLAGVTHIDSTGIGRFIRSYHRIAAVGGEMRMAGAAGHLFQVFHVSQLDRMFPFYPGVAEACKA